MAKAKPVKKADVKKAANKMLDATRDLKLAKQREAARRTMTAEEQASYKYSPKKGYSTQSAGERAAKLDSKTARKSLGLTKKTASKRKK